MMTLSDITGWIRYEGAFIVPYIFVLFLFVLGVLSLPVPILFGVKVPFALMAIYYWCMYRPAMLPSWLLFIIGLMTDILSGLPLGGYAMIYVIVGWLVSRKRRFLLSQPFLVIWFFYALLHLGMGLLQWGLYSLVTWTLIDPLPVAVSWGIGVLLFPAVLLLLRLTHRILPIKQSGV